VFDPTTLSSIAGVERRNAVIQAAAYLVERYRRRWASIVPIELNRLAYTLDAQIKRVPEVHDGARLIPVRGGFCVLVGHNLPRSKYRTSVAHELAHTLFYSRAAEMPQQLVAPTAKEEHFCFDVARRVLAPDYLIKSADLWQEPSARCIFRRLTDPNGSFQLSQPVAARVMLADYELAVGVAGRCVKEGNEWTIQAGAAAVSPKLCPSDRTHLWTSVRHWLTDATEPSGYHIFGQTAPDSLSAFVVAVRAAT
jgi:hypothetical protein